MVRCGVVGVWDRLPWLTRSILIAQCRAEDTMREWEAFVNRPKDSK